MARQLLVSDQIRQIEQARLGHLTQAPGDGPNTMARVIGVGVVTADMLVQGNRPLDAATDFGASFARALLRVLQIFRVRRALKRWCRCLPCSPKQAMAGTGAALRVKRDVPPHDRRDF